MIFTSVDKFWHVRPDRTTAVRRGLAPLTSSHFMKSDEQARAQMNPTPWV